MESSLSTGKDLLNPLQKHSQTPAVDLIPPMVVQTLPRPAGTSTYAASVIAADTQCMIVRRTRKPTQSLQPKYLRHNVWREYSFSSTTSDWSETAQPLPRPPATEENNPITSKTIHDHASLFYVSTPINVDRFQHLLRNHPNPLFVQSVCEGLHDGFWPWADTLMDGYPTTHNASNSLPSTDREATFLCEQVHTEETKGQLSAPFHGDLLPGMYSMPIHAVPKTLHSTELRMVTNHSAGPFSLNSMIPRCDIMAYPLDNMKHLGEVLMDL